MYKEKVIVIKLVVSQYQPQKSFLLNVKTVKNKKKSETKAYNDHGA